MKPVDSDHLATGRAGVSGERIGVDLGAAISGVDLGRPHRASVRAAPIGNPGADPVHERPSHTPFWGAQTASNGLRGSADAIGKPPSYCRILEAGPLQAVNSSDTSPKIS